MGEHAAGQIDPHHLPSPFTDAHGDAGFRRRLTATLVSRALAEASQRPGARFRHDRLGRRRAAPQGRPPDAAGPGPVRRRPHPPGVAARGVRPQPARPRPASTRSTAPPPARPRACEPLFTAESLGHPYLLATAGTGRVRPYRDAHPGRGAKVRFVGEPVAMVIADDAYRAEDAAELVEVDWDPQPAVMSMETATAAAAPRLHDHGNCLVDLLMFDDDRLPEIFAGARRHRQRHLPQRPGRRPAAGGTRLPGRMGRPRRPAGHARLHPGPAPGPFRRRAGPAACRSAPSG